MVTPTRRETLTLGAGGFIAALIGPRGSAEAAGTDTLTIAFNVYLPSFDPMVGNSSVNPAIQAIYRSIFDQYIGQKPNLTFEPGLLTAWGWNDDKTQVWMDVREGVTWHDGSPLTPQDVVWSLERASDAKNGNPVSYIWGSLVNYKIEGKRITADVKVYRSTIFKWMAFLSGYVLPKDYYTKVGKEAFEKRPIGTGPYMFDAYQGNAFLRLKANPKYWGGKPAFETVIFKFVTDATSRVAEIESGSSDLTLEIPYEEFDRLKQKKGLSGVADPISDIGMIFINSKYQNVLTKDVRLAAHHAIDKRAIVDRLLRGFGVPIDTLEAPDYVAFDPAIKVGYDPVKAERLMKAAGHSPENPIKITIQTTRGLKPKDYEMIQAIVGMWRKIGINAEIEVYEIAKHFELRAKQDLAPFAFYNWGNAIADPETSTARSCLARRELRAGRPPMSTPKSARSSTRRMRPSGSPAGKLSAGYVAEQGDVIPLLQYVQPIVYKSNLMVVPNKSGAMQPTLVSAKS